MQMFHDSPLPRSNTVGYTGNATEQKHFTRWVFRYTPAYSKGRAGV